MPKRSDDLIKRRDRCRRHGHTRPTPESRCTQCGANAYIRKGTPRGVPHPATAVHTVLSGMQALAESRAPSVPSEVSAAVAPAESTPITQPGGGEVAPVGAEPAVDSPGGAAAVVNAEAAATPEPPQVVQAAPSPGVPAAPADAVNAAAGAGPEKPVEVQKPSVQIPAALVRAGLAGGCSWLAEKGASFALRRFGPRGPKGEMFRPGPATWTISDEMLDKFNVSKVEREQMGVTPTAPLEFPVSDILAEGIRIELERLGMTKDVNIHPLIVVGVGLVAIPATMVWRSPDFQAELAAPPAPDEAPPHAPLHSVDDGARIDQ